LEKAEEGVGTGLKKEALWRKRSKDAPEGHPWKRLSRTERTRPRDW